MAECHKSHIFYYIQINALPTTMYMESKVFPCDIVMNCCSVNLSRYDDLTIYHHFRLEKYMFSKCLLRHDVVRVFVSSLVLVFVRAILS